jgi:hypothetical protein
MPAVPTCFMIAWTRPSSFGEARPEFNLAEPKCRACGDTGFFTVVKNGISSARPCKHDRAPQPSLGDRAEPFDMAEFERAGARRSIASGPGRTRT